MSNNNSTAASGGIGFVSLLTLVFIVLKLTGVISWSWVWVLAPMWISFLVSLVIILIVVVVLMVINHK